VQTIQSAPAKAWNGAGTAGRAALGAVAGGAALGFAGWTAIKRARRPRVLGVPLPRKAPKVKAPTVNLKKMAKQIGDVAEQIEQTGDEVRRVSAQAKKVSRALS
jgi:hypothetical protein